MSEDYIEEDGVLVKRAATLKKVVWVLTVVVIGLVVAMRSPSKISVSSGVAETIKLLPGVIAIINTLVAACLLSGLWCVMRMSYKAHQAFMTMALMLSVVFLICYVTYHFTTVETKYGDLSGNGRLEEIEIEKIGAMRYVYLTILFSHIVAAAVSFPMILMTFVHAWSQDFEKHTKLARKTFPLWLFVAVSGPVCYYMLKPYY